MERQDSASERILDRQGFNLTSKTGDGTTRRQNGPQLPCQRVWSLKFYFQICVLLRTFSVLFNFDFCRASMLCYCLGSTPGLGLT